MVVVPILAEHREEEEARCCARLAVRDHPVLIRRVAPQMRLRCVAELTKPVAVHVKPTGR